MNNLKLKIRNAITILFGDKLQKEDNNWSFYNKLENCHLTMEFEMRKALLLTENQINTFNKLKQYFAKKNGIKSEEEQRKTARNAYINFKKVGFIDEDCKLLKGVDEAIMDYIN